MTRLLAEAQDGVPGAADRLAAQVHADLRRIADAALAREAAGHTLQPTEIADEAFVRLVAQERVTWQSRTHFFAVAAGIIRRILIDHARARRRKKRDHGIRVTLGDDVASTGEPDRLLDLLALDEALGRLAEVAPRPARVVELRFFGGLEVPEVAAVLETSPATVKRDWTFARAFLLDAMGSESAG
ncbi:MAG: ECF-type sigma factor [Gemmatimonadales bacterium]